MILQLFLDMDSFENVKNTITLSHTNIFTCVLTSFMVQEIQNKLLCIPKEDVADPEMQKILLSVAILFGRIRCHLLCSLTLCLFTYYSF